MGTESVPNIKLHAPHSSAHRPAAKGRAAISAAGVAPKARPVEKMTVAEYRSLTGKPLRHKYRAKPTVVDGIRFDSKREAVYFQELRLRERAGEIRDLQRQVPFRFSLEGGYVFTYLADFVFADDTGRHVVDLKGVDTPVSKLKRKLIAVLYRIRIEVVR